MAEPCHTPLFAGGREYALHAPKRQPLTAHDGAKTMKQQFYLTFSQGGGVPKVTKNRPAVAPDEVCAAFEVDLPDSLFTRPQLYAQVQIPDPETPMKIDTEVTGQITEAIRKSTGLQVNLSVVDPEERPE